MTASGQLLLGLLVLLGLAVGSWYVLAGVAAYLTGLEASIVSPVIAGFVAVFLALFGYWKEKSRERAEVHRSQKVEVYSLFFDMIFTVIRHSKQPSGAQSYIDSAEFQDTFFKLMRGAVFYASPHVLNALSRWKTQVGSSTDPLHPIKLVGDVLLAMRSDIGLSNFGLDNLSVHQIYVTDDLRKPKKKVEA